MRLKRHVPLLESTLNRVGARPLNSSLCNRCRYSSTSAAYPENIAVLGGGISGLSSAYFVSKEFPNSKITVFESGKEAGGWIRSRRVGVPGGDALFEYGPRTLRPGAGAMATAQLVQELDLLDDVVYTKRNSAGARNRYIYYPDQLNRLPSPGEPPSLANLFDLWRTGVLAGGPNAIAEYWQPQRPRSMTDETVGSFISRRVDKRIAQNVVSAVMHGIYAGDIWQLSAKTLLSLPWQLESRYGSALKGLYRLNNEQASSPEPVTLYHPYDLEALNAMRREIELEDKFVDQLAGSSMFTFKNGLQQLVQRLQQSLEKNDQVEIKLDSSVQSFKRVQGSSQQVEVVTGDEPSQTKQNFDLVISTLRNKPLTDYVTVMTVNLFYPNPKLLPVSGFGYLIPQSVPFEQNPERALGVIFDSDAVAGQDSAQGTKLTVMLGGHWWNGWSAYPDTHEGAELAKSVIQRQLGIAEEPVACHVNLHRDCIPQYTIGYEDRLREFAQGVRDEFRGRLRVVGNQFSGVGVNDCIKSAWLMAKGLRDGGWKGRDTGLERALDEREWVVGPMAMRYREDERKRGV